jgi:hypothetical protein
VKLDFPSIRRSAVCLYARGRRLPGNLAYREPRRTARQRSRIELLIDCEEDRTLRAVLVGMLREADR